MMHPRSRIRLGTVVAAIANRQPVFRRILAPLFGQPPPSLRPSVPVTRALFAAAATTAGRASTAVSLATLATLAAVAAVPAPIYASAPKHASPDQPPLADTALLRKTPDSDSRLLSRYAVADAVEGVLPAVVNIRRVITRPASFLFEPEAVEVSCGSGFFISSDGHVLTNSHVVADRLRHTDQSADAVLQVTLSTGETYPARVLAADPDSDIAIIKVNADHDVPVARLGDSDAVRTGEFVVAVGSPLTLSNTVSFGIVSTIQRDLGWSTGESSGGMTYMQLDMAINQGSSGGPCLSLDGEVIGICSMKIAGDAEGIGFAIPIKYAQRVVDDLQTHGYVRRPFVGLTLISVTPDLFEDIRKDTNYRPPRWLEAEMRGTNSSKSVGLMVHNITKGGPGDRAGLHAGDVVVAVNNMRTTTTSEFLAALSFQVHKDCELKVRRGASGRVEKVTIRPELLRKRERQ